MIGFFLFSVYAANIVGSDYLAMLATMKNLGCPFGECYFTNLSTANACSSFSSGCGGSGVTPCIECDVSTGHVTNFNMAMLGLNGTVGSEIALLSWLTVLQLAYNDITGDLTLIGSLSLLENL